MERAVVESGGEAAATTGQQKEFLQRLEPGKSSSATAPPSKVIRAREAEPEYSAKKVSKMRVLRVAATQILRFLVSARISGSLDCSNLQVHGPGWILVWAGCSAST